MNAHRKQGRRRRPPKRRCPLCGTDHYAWQEDALCKACRPELDSGIADIVREQRAERQVRPAAVRPAAVPYNTFPDGF